ncbi:MAG: hypothetical protein Q7U02_01865, partial [Desulfosalsimonadaceae bacterium]|nr:hypothetical protein [Desulfosalsimonadaceae bacterium]
MTSKSKNLKKAVPSKSVSRGRALKQSKKIKTPVQTIPQAVTQNEVVEHKVAKAEDDLNRVNAELAKEVAERVVIESELADTKTDLAEALDDLSKSQAKEEDALKIGLHDALTGLPNRVL